MATCTCRTFAAADQVYNYDCIEFNPRFRYGDVAADIDFLAMDLDFHGFRDLSHYLVERLAQAAGDPELLVMLDFYKCYRAYVRGKVAAFSARDPELSPKSRDQAENTARAYFVLAGEYAAAGAPAGRLSALFHQSGNIFINGAPKSETLFMRGLV